MHCLGKGDNVLVQEVLSCFHSSRTVDMKQADNLSLANYMQLSGEATCLLHCRDWYVHEVGYLCSSAVSLWSV